MNDLCARSDRPDLLDKEGRPGLKVTKGEGNKLKYFILEYTLGARIKGSITNFSPKNCLSLSCYNFVKKGVIVYLGLFSFFSTVIKQIIPKL